MKAKLTTPKNTVAIIGLGYVGLPLAVLADQKKYQVIGIDIDIEKVTKLQKKILPFKDGTLIEDLRKSTILFTTDFKKVSEARTVVICVPTPVHDNHMPDIGPVRGACEHIAAYMKPGTLVVLESTVNPGVSEEIVLPALEAKSGLKAGVDFHLAHCPERINPGDHKWDVHNIPRVLGALNPEGLKKAYAFYTSIIEAPVKKMASLKEAEAVKIVENSFRDINIAFVNELARSFSKLNINVMNVINGASTKPFAFMAHYPGCGVGGHCIPVDPYYLIEYAKQNGFNHRFLSLAREINNQMPRFTVELVQECLRAKNISLKGSKIAVLGLAYKPNVSDIRESPSLEIIKELQKEEADVVVFDPFIKNESSVHNMKDALKDVKAVIIATAHSAFTKLTPAYMRKSGVPIIVDGRNCLDGKRFSDYGIVYRGIGVSA